MAIPVFTLGQIITQLQTQWGGAAEANGYTYTWSGSSITYSVGASTPTNAAAYGYASPSEGGSHLVALTALEKSTAELAFELWDDLIALSLVENTSAAANITFNYSNATNGDGTYAYFWSSGATGTVNRLAASQVWIASDWSTNQSSNLTAESYGVATYIHEIGHALGLSHPGTYDASGGGSITYANNAEYTLDNRKYTIMSYFGGYNPTTKSWTQDGTLANWYYPNTPMVDDIAAIQAKYGADLTTRSGNTIYGFHCNLAGSDPEKALYDFSVNTHPILAIWDGGGTDTLDASGYASAQTIDLTPGNYSSLVGMNGNVGIAYNCIIENAIGGAGNDVIIGNTSGNVITGGGGADTLTGGAGADTFTVLTLSDSSRSAPDTITDFQAGIDKIDVSGLTGAAVGLLYFGGSTLFSTAPDISGVGQIQINATGHIDAADVITGGTPNFYITGSSAADVIIGSAGNDRIAGNGGADILTGGSGADRFVVLAVSDSSRSAPDTITDFQAGIDKIDVSGLTGAAVGLLYFGGSTLFSTAPDISGVGQIQINSTGHIDAADVITGGTPNFYIVGSSAAEVIVGSASRDIIDGDGGADILTGGAGVDTFVIRAVSDSSRSGPDTITDFQAGIDTIDVSGLTGGAVGLLYFGNSTLFSTAPDINGIGQIQINATGHIDAADVITGGTPNFYIVGSSAAETIVGGASRDLINGGGGADILTGGLGADVFIFNRGYGAATINDFTNSGPAADVLQLHGVASSAADAMSHAVQSGTDAFFDFGAGDTVTLHNVSVASLHLSDFTIV